MRWAKLCWISLLCSSTCRVRGRFVLQNICVFRKLQVSASSHKNPVYSALCSVWIHAFNSQST